MNSIELLAPAGSLEAFVAAVQNGANAVYLGGNAFSARAFATNFSNEELTQAIQYGHMRNVKIYVTINTLYSDEQFDELMSYVSFLYHQQVDAVIVQDVGLINLIKSNFPDLEIHMSTQASIYNKEGVSFFEELGIQRVVLARENMIEEIQDICKHTSLDIEVFVHGALCMGYSGQCLMSSFIGKRSGNKGMCAQPCRLPYTLLKDDKVISEEAFLLSPKDLCTIEHVGDLIEAGITSFKIEGRMKRPEYVATIVKTYRQAIDTYLKNKQIDICHEDIVTMKKMFNRGFTKGYIFNDQNFMAKKFPGNRGIKIGYVKQYLAKQKRVSISLQDTLSQQDRIIFNDHDFTRTVTKLYYQGRLVNKAEAGQIVEIELDSKVKPNEEVYKVIDNQALTLAKKSYQQEHCRIPITMQFTGHIGKIASLTITDQKHTVSVASLQTVEQAISTPLTKQRIQQQLEKLGNSIYFSNQTTIIFDDHATLSIKELNQMRREAIEELNQLRSNQKIHFSNHTASIQPIEKTEPRQVSNIAIKVLSLEQLETALSYDFEEYFFPLNNELGKAIKLASKYHKKIIPYTGFMLSNNSLEDFIASSYFNMIDTVLVGNYGALMTLKNKKKCILDTHFNIYNSYATQFFQEYPIILSQELSYHQIQALSCFNEKVYYYGYGKVEMMISKHCPISEHYHRQKIKGCNRCKGGIFALRDRKAEQFFIHMDTFCCMHLYNSHPLLLDEVQLLPVDSIILSFTDESKKEVKTIIEDYVNNILTNKNSQIKSKAQYTSGYFYE